MHAIHIIKKPLVTEKTTAGMNDRNHYTFLVDRRATKDDVRKAVEELYGVKVVGVNTVVRKGRARRLRYGWVQESVSKKAIVRLKAGDKIELY